MLTRPQESSKRRLLPHLELHSAALIAEKRSRTSVNKELKAIPVIISEPATSHTPPSTPPQRMQSLSFSCERDRSDSAPLSGPLTPELEAGIKLEHHQQGPPPFRRSEFYRHSQPQLDGSISERFSLESDSSASDYSERSFARSRCSNIFNRDPPGIASSSMALLDAMVPDTAQPDMPPARQLGGLSLARTLCAICEDPNMIQLNGIELQCGHFTHLSCLKEARKELHGARPTCNICESEPRRTNSLKTSDPPKSLRSSKSVEQEELLGRKRSQVQDSPSLLLQMYVHSQSTTSHELLVKVSMPAGAFEQWRYRSTPADIAAARKLTSAALGVASLGRSHINSETAGRFRLVSTFRVPQRLTKVTAYLFDYAVIITAMAADGFEELVHSVDLKRDNVTIHGTAETIAIIVGSATLRYQASRKTVAKWTAATRDLTLNFPIAKAKGLQEPWSPVYMERCLLQLIVCLPYELLAAVPYVLSNLGPLDKLGLVVTAPGGSCAWLAPQKIHWVGWQFIAQDPTDCFDLFTPARRSVLETADELLGSPETGVQKSVALVAGCPLVTTKSSNLVHVIGIGQYDLRFLSSIALENGGQFYHTHNASELKAVLGGLAAAERTYTHHDVQLFLSAVPGIKITDVVGMDARRIKKRASGISLSLGSIMAGQSRTILMELVGTTDGTTGFLSACNIQATSAITNRQQWQNQATHPFRSAEFQIFFDRMARIASEILDQGVELVDAGRSDEFTAMLGRAVAAIQRAVTGHLSEHREQRQSLFELTDPSATASVTAAKAKILARGLEELQQQFVNSKQSSIGAKAVLLQASLVLQSQRAVTHRTLLEQVFYERLETNRL